MNSDKTTQILQSRIQYLTRRNRELEKIREQYQRVCRSEKERIKELSCLYQVAQCVVVETDRDRALEKIVRIIPSGWQYADDACACITVQGERYLSENFFHSGSYQHETIFLDKQPVGNIKVFYGDSVEIGSPDPFLIEERNLLKGIASIISFYLKKLKDEDNARLIQQQFLHVDRLATIGRLSAGVAHELNEPLSNILGLAQLTLKSPDLAQQTKTDLEKIERRVLYAREIIKSLMDFSRQSSMEKKPIDLSRLMDDSISFLEARCSKSGIVIKKDYAIDPVIISVDPVQIKQVITNLALNGIQAMENGGTLTITIRKTAASAIFSIQDTGIGISRQNISKAFVPFFTTKDVGKGTGLGLSVVYGIVQNHKGDIKVNSYPEKGTIFHVTLPLETDE